MAGLEVSVEMKRSDYGTPRPTLALTFPVGQPYRVSKAALYRVAALAEELSGDARWVVNVSGIGMMGYARGDCASVWIELGGGSDRDAEQAMAMLRRLADRVKEGGL